MASNAVIRDHGTSAGFPIDGLFEETIQFQALPQIQPQETGAELPRSFQTYFVQQHPRYLRIVLGRSHMRRKQFQLLRIALIVEDLNGLQPARLRRAVQFAQIANRFLTRTVWCAHRLHQRPVRVILAVLLRWFGRKNILS